MANLKHGSNRYAGNDFDFPEGESLSPEDIVRDWDDPNDFSWWQPAFAALAPPSEEDAS
jgi:hypothetical protein